MWHIVLFDMRGSNRERDRTRLEQTLEEMRAYNIQESKWILEDGSIDPKDIHRKIRNFLNRHDRLFIATFLEHDAIVVNPIEPVPEFDTGQ